MTREKSNGEIIWDALHKYPIIIVKVKISEMTYKMYKDKLFVTYLSSNYDREWSMIPKDRMIVYLNDHNYSLVDYIELDNSQSIKINGDICKCDFYKQILPYGCNCGGK